ncbi:hypothetical protein GCM10010519_47530 [Streptomyces lactacystinicus]
MISVPWCQDRTRRTHRVSADALRAAPYRSVAGLSVSCATVAAPTATRGDEAGRSRMEQSRTERSGTAVGWARRPGAAAGPPGRQAATPPEWASLVPLIPGAALAAGRWAGTGRWSEERSQA